MPSGRVNAQTPGIRLLAQIFGFVWRHPSVCIAVSFGRRGSLKTPCWSCFGVIFSRFV